MQGEPVEYVEGQSLAMRFPILARYQNPIGYMQGGFIVAALDNTLGPFSYLIATPSVTTSLNTQYLRPVTPDLTHITCHAKLVERTRNQLFLPAKYVTTRDAVLVMCQAVCQILPQKAG